MSSSRLLKSVGIVVGVILSAFFTYLAVRNVNLRIFWKGLSESDYAWLIPALLVLAVAVWLRAVRWWLLFARTTRPPLRAVTSALMIGYLFNQILPARAGEAARVVALYQETGTSRAEAAGTAVVERVYDVVSLLVLLFVASPFLPRVGWLRQAAVLALVVAVLLVAAVVVVSRYRERPLRYLLRPIALVPRISVERTDAAALNLAEGLAALHRASLAVPAFAVTVLSWLVAAFSFWLVIVGFHLSLVFGAGLLVLIATNLGMVIPSLPAAVGVFEAATIVSLKAYGVGDSRALSVAVVLHALNFFPYLAVGVLALRRHATAVRRRARLAAS